MGNKDKVFNNFIAEVSKITSDLETLCMKTSEKWLDTLDEDTPEGKDKEPEC